VLTAKPLTLDPSAAAQKCVTTGTDILRERPPLDWLDRV
jgi:hypothetical protein